MYGNIIQVSLSLSLSSSFFLSLCLSVSLAYWIRSHEWTTHGLGERFAISLSHYSDSDTRQHRSALQATGHCTTCRYCKFCQLRSHGGSYTSCVEMTELHQVLFSYARRSYNSRLNEMIVRLHTFAAESVSMSTQSVGHHILLSHCNYTCACGEAALQSAAGVMRPARTRRMRNTNYNPGDPRETRVAKLKFCLHPS